MRNVAHAAASLIALVSVLLIVGACDSEHYPAEHAKTFRRSLNSDPESLDPHKYRSTQAGTVLRDLGEGLLTYSSNGGLSPGVAARWDVSVDGLEYTFYLNPDARWSNGDPVVAEDFVRSFRRLFDPETAAPTSSLSNVIENAKSVLNGEVSSDELGVVAFDSGTLTVRLESPTPYFLQVLTHPSTFPLHSEFTDQSGDRRTAPGNYVSNGAYQLAERVVSSTITMTRNPHYWNNQNTWFDTVLYKIADPTAELLQYRAGELDFTDNLDMRSFKMMQESRPDEVKVAPALTVYYYGFNLTRPPFKDNPRLRAALSMAIDRDTLVAAVTGRGEVPAYSFVPPGMQFYEPQLFEYQSLTDVERHKAARRLYAEAGYSLENPAEFELRYNTLGDHEKIAIAIQSMWRDVLGVDAQLVNEEFKVLISNIQAMDETEAFRLSWSGDYLDPHTFLQLFETDNPNNLTGFSNPAFDALFRRASTELNQEKRADYLQRAEALALSEHPVIPLYFFVNKHLVASDIAGYRHNLFDIHYSKHFRRLQASEKNIPYR